MKFFMITALTLLNSTFLFADTFKYNCYVHLTHDKTSESCVASGHADDVSTFNLECDDGFNLHSNSATTSVGSHEYFITAPVNSSGSGPYLGKASLDIQNFSFCSGHYPAYVSTNPEAGVPKFYFGSCTISFLKG